MFTFTTTDLDLSQGAAQTCMRISGFHVAAGGAAANVLLRNGGASGTIFVDIKVPTGTSVHFSSDKPIAFPKGIYVDTDANVSNGSIQPG